jgi:hypothetical protein
MIDTYFEITVKILDTKYCSNCPFLKKYVGGKYWCNHLWDHLEFNKKENKCNRLKMCIELYSLKKVGKKCK